MMHRAWGDLYLMPRSMTPQDNVTVVQY